MSRDIYRVGIGCDLHRLVKGRKLFLGGIQIPYSKGLTGHSDADVLLHAICDALLGAAGLADIGQHFPDTDIKYKDISSTILLKNVLRLIRGKGFTIINLDSTVVAQAPQLSLWRSKIEKSIAKILRLNHNLINLKATTQEGLGEVGKKKAIVAWCVVLLRRAR